MTWKDPETILITLDDIVSGDPDASLSADPTATVFIVDEDGGLQTIRMEAEAFDQLTGYELFANADSSGGYWLQVPSQNGTGTASTLFAGAAGNYDVKLGAIDEKDGDGMIEIYINSSLEASYLLDDVPFSAALDSRIEPIVARDLFLNPGDEIKIVGIADGGEFARVDFLEFIQNGSLGVELFVETTSNAGEPGTDGAFTVRTTSPVTAETVVSYTISGSASEGADYQSLGVREVTIQPGMGSADIPVVVIDDQDPEPSEQVIVTLSDILSGDPDISFGSNVQAVLEIADDDGFAQTIRMEAEAFDQLTGV